MNQRFTYVATSLTVKKNLILSKNLPPPRGRSNYFFKLKVTKPIEHLMAPLQQGFLMAVFSKA